MSGWIAKGVAPGASPGSQALGALPAIGSGQASLKWEAGMLTNYGYKPSRGAKHFGDKKEFQAARKKRLRKLESKARRAREQIKLLGAK